MERKHKAMATAFVVLIMTTLLIGVALAYPSNSLNASESFAEHYQEMAELHRQYANNEISYEQFIDGMNEEMEELGMPCHAGRGMMGFYA